MPPSHIKKFDQNFIGIMHEFGVPLLRAALAIVFIWFGALKIVGLSPVAKLVGDTYAFFGPNFLPILGCFELVIGFGLLFEGTLRPALALLWLQMAGTIFSLVLNPNLFFLGGNPLLLTTEGEFVIKNLVLISASIVIGGQVRPYLKTRSR